MKIQVNSNQLERIVIKWLNTYYGNLELITTEKYPESIFYVDSNDDVMLQYDEREIIYIDNIIWSQIQSIFNLSDNDVKSIIKVWLKETYKLEGLSPYRG